MKHLLLLTILFNLQYFVVSTALAQEDFIGTELENENSDFESAEDLSDDEEIDFETDDFVESGDIDTDKDQAQNQNLEEESARPEAKPQTEDLTEQEINATANQIEDSLEPEGNGELSFEPGTSYVSFRDSKYDWSVFAHYGYQFSSVSSDFAESTSLVNLPNEYTDMGLDIVKKVSLKPYVWGARLQVLTEEVTSSTYKAEYKMNLATAFVGYRLIDNILNISATLGLVLPISSSSKLSTVSGSSSVDKDLKLGLSYTAGVMSVVALKQFLIGFDGGLLILQGQKLDGEKVDSAQAGYLRLLLGLAF